MAVIVDSEAKTKYSWKLYQTNPLSVFIAARISRDLCAGAQEESLRIVAEGKSRAARGEIEARERGFTQGLKQALKTVLEAELLKRRIIASSKAAVIETAICVAEEVIGEALEVQPQSVVMRAERALEYAKSGSGLTVVCSPKDAEEVKKWLAIPNSAFTSSFHPQLREDAALVAGTIRLETEFGIVEACPQQHLQAIRQVLMRTSETDDFLSFEPEGIRCERC